NSRQTGTGSIRSRSCSRAPGGTMVGWFRTLVLAGAALVSVVSAKASTDVAGPAPAGACLQLAAAPRAPVRPSGREVRIVTYIVADTLDVVDAVGHPEFFGYPSEGGAAGGCARTAERWSEPSAAPRGRAGRQPR